MTDPTVDDVGLDALGVLLCGVTDLFEVEFAHVGGDVVVLVLEDLARLKPRTHTVTGDVEFVRPQFGAFFGGQTLVRWHVWP
mgnify:CR=1 FL=1